MKKRISISSFVRKLRQNQTEAEKILWTKLRDKRLDGTKFRRQQQIGPHIVDFVSFDKKIIIELDGGHHNSELRKKNDAARTKWLRSQGFEVVRFWNNELMKDLDDALEFIHTMLKITSVSSRTPHLDPLPQGERNKR